MTHRLRIGLTGGIASGKSTVAQRFVELGVAVIDADEVARAVVAPNQMGLAQVVQRFGPAILAADGTLDRRALRELIFSDPAQRRALEEILHPLIRAEMGARARSAVGPYVVLAIPLLVEGGRDADRVDRILVVDTDEAAQVARVVARDACTPDQARAIIAAQASREARLQAADNVIVNSGTLSELRQRVDETHRHYLELAATSDGRGSLP